MNHSRLRLYKTLIFLVGVLLPVLPILLPCNLSSLIRHDEQIVAVSSRRCVHHDHRDVVVCLAEESREDPQTPHEV